MSLHKQKVEMKKQEIIRSAAKTLQEKGFYGTTMEEIAAQLLMTKGSLYHYFKNKEDLLYQCHKIILDISIDKIEAIIDTNQSNTNKIEEIIRFHINLALEENALFSLIDNPEHTFSEENFLKISKRRSYYAKCIDKVLEQGLEDGEFRNIDIKMTRFIILGALNWIQQWYNPDGERNPTEIADYFVDKLLQTLR
ncbi:TetR/AcrR family transcriptional regulator [Alkalihalobacterium elongatum]|uniref:TetR/AcrR family transcriptional regulator n=1 Tax=Alkalihalobacterium elongatum TaxID=2675466 RepID=UPI001C1F5839|nr:TetR/AcrR family transcriptional regulator [Alkalihalobacterium elongatum]